MASFLSPLSSRLLLGCWFSQLLLAVVVVLLAPIPVRPLVIERRHCSDQQWAGMLQRYRQLVLRDRLGMERYRPVIQYSVFGERRSEGLPPAAALALASAVGDGDRLEQSSLLDRYPTALVLSCYPLGNPAAAATVGCASGPCRAHRSATREHRPDRAA